MDAAFDPASLTSATGAPFLVLALIAAVFELLVGVAVGWWLRSGKKMIPAPAGVFAGAADSIQCQSADHQTAACNLQVAEHALTNLRELATQVQADVGAHSTHVEAISNKLTTEQSTGTAAESNVMDAVTKILEANRRLEQQLHSAENKLERQAEQIRFHAANALTDALTGLGNRRAFDAEISRRIAEFQRHGTPFCLMILDVDHFKKFNDTHGHLAGDEVLRLVGRTLKNTVRTPDFVTRYGGEEFGVIMPHTVLEETKSCAERVRVNIELSECEFEGKKLCVTASIGVAQFGTDQNATLLVQCADEALYAAKQSGRNRVQFHGASGAESEAKPVEAPSEPIATNGMHQAELLNASAAKSGGNRTDIQTGLPNRTSFCEEIRRRLAEGQRHGNRLSLMLVKVDDLTAANHDRDSNISNLVIRTCTQFLTAAMREMDMVARYDHDVFGIVLPGTALIHATGASERLRAAIEHCPLKLGNKDVRFTISTGLAEAQPGEDFVTFLKRAEDAKDNSVTAGGNKVRFHTGISIEAFPESATAARV